MTMHLYGSIIKDMHGMVAMCLLVRYSDRKTLTDCKCNLSKAILLSNLVGLDLDICFYLPKFGG